MRAYGCWSARTSIRQRQRKIHAAKDTVREGNSRTCVSRITGRRRNQRQGTVMRPRGPSMGASSFGPWAFTLCIARGREKRLTASRVTPEKILNGWGFASDHSLSQSDHGAQRSRRERGQLRCRCMLGHKLSELVNGTGFQASSSNTSANVDGLELRKENQLEGRPECSKNVAKPASALYYLNHL